MSIGLCNLDLDVDTATALRRLLGWTEVGLRSRRFPDGETYLRLLMAEPPEELVLLADLSRPDAKLLSLIFAAATARELGVKRVGLLAPYLPYMRQDKAFATGEAVSSRHFATVLGHWVDWLVTVDPHLHRYSALGDVYAIPAHRLRAAPLLARWLESHVARPVLIGPDQESVQWVGEVAEAIEAPFVVLRKTRRGDRDVALELPPMDGYLGREPVLVDDIISTGGTLAQATAKLREAGFTAVTCLAVHALFSGSALAALRSAGATRVVTCNTIRHPTNGVDVTPLLADGLRAAVSR